MVWVTLAWLFIKVRHRLRELGLKRSVMNHAPGRYLRLDLFIKVLSLLCPNLTDASSSSILLL